MNSSPLTVHYQLLSSDIQSARQLLNGGKTGVSPQKLIRTLLVLFALILMFAFVFKTQMPAPRSASFSPGVSRGFSWIPLLPVLLPVALLPIFYVIAAKQAKQNSPILQHPSTLTLSNDDFRVEFGSTSVTQRWDGVPRVENTPQHLLLLTQPTDGYIVPRRAFNSDEEFARFCEFARQRCEAAKPQTPPIAGV